MDDSTAGAMYFKCALQVNPHGYASRFRGKQGRGSREEYERALIERAVDLGIGVLAITDHNSVESVASISDRATRAGITVFPGFEVTSQEGVHFLCIFDPSTNPTTLERYLGTLGITDTSPNSSLSNKSCLELPTLIANLGGIAIAAHVTNDGGLLTALTGSARTKAWKQKDLLAVQIPGSVADLPLRYRQIITNKNPHYMRHPSASSTLSVAVVNAKDVSDPDELANPAATCFIKMTVPSIGALRQAFLDPASRIRLNSDEEPDERSRLISIEYEGGYLDGLKVRFNPNLNVIIGGKGTGKSTLLESIRYVLDRRPIGPNAQIAHDAVVQNVLRPGTRISLAVHSPRPAPRRYLIERVVGGRPQVKDDTGRDLKLHPSDVIGEIAIFGQHEISELAGMRGRLDLLIERFAPRIADLRSETAQVRTELAANRLELLKALTSSKKLASPLARLPAMREELQRFQEAGVEAILAGKASLVREQEILNAAGEYIADRRQYFSEITDWDPIEVDFLSDDALRDLPGNALLREIRPVIAALNAAVERTLGELEQHLEAASDKLASIRRRWTTERESPVNKEYQRTLRKLGKKAIEAETFVALKERIERLASVQKRLEVQSKAIDSLWEKRRRLLSRLDNCVQREFRALSVAAKAVSSRLRGQVRVSVSFCNDRAPLVQLIRETVGGRLAETERAIMERPDCPAAELAAECRTGAAALRDWLGISMAQAVRICEHGEELFMAIEEVELPHTTDVFLNVSGDANRNDWKPLSSLSAGQKATAVLLLLLLEAAAPLIIDQPEDDLDNRFIAEGIVPRMREEKRRRQFVFSTHNANLPVLGDAELILAFQACSDDDTGHTRLPDDCRGSIDLERIQHLVEEILEGGRAAFETRRRKYGF